MGSSQEFAVLAGLDPAAQLEWLRALRPRTAHIELLFHDNDVSHPLTPVLAWLGPTRTVGVGARPGYSRPQPSAVLHRYSYDRTIVQEIERLGGFFECIPDPRGDRVRYTGLGNVDVTLRDRHDAVLGSTVTHEGLLLIPAEPPGLREGRGA